MHRFSLFESLRWPRQKVVWANPRNESLRRELDGEAAWLWAGWLEVDLLACFLLSVPAVAALGPPFFPIAKNVKVQNKMKIKVLPVEGMIKLCWHSKKWVWRKEIMRLRSGMSWACETRKKKVEVDVELGIPEVPDSWVMCDKKNTGHELCRSPRTLNHRPLLISISLVPPKYAGYLRMWSIIQAQWNSHPPATKWWSSLQEKIPWSWPNARQLGEPTRNQGWSGYS